MRKFLISLVLSFAAVSFSFAGWYAEVEDDLSFNKYFNSITPLIGGGGVHYIPLTQSEKDIGWDSLATTTKQSKVDAVIASVQANKSLSLKAAENAMISWLRRNSYIATNAVSVPVTIETSVVTNLMAQAELSPTNLVVASEISRFHATLDLIERYGGKLNSIRWHE